MTPLRIAVIGSGITGLSAAWLLSQRHSVTLFEQDTRFGGHSHTVDAALPEGPCAVDTGFIVYNTKSYPNLIALFGHLGVETAKTKMSFAVSIGGKREYSGSGLGGLIGHWQNIAHFGHWGMVYDLLRFFRQAERDMADPTLACLTLKGYLHARGYRRSFIDDHIAPMAAAIWSTPSRDVLAFPVQSFVRFFDNHGLLQVASRPEWRTVKGGSRNYVQKLLAAIGPNAHAGRGAKAIKRLPHGVVVEDTDGALHPFDHVLIAAHADQALGMLADPDEAETATLGAFQYADNHAVLHTDPALMPRRRRLWSSWNYITAGSGRADDLCVSYWMNSLQPLETHRDIFVTLNPHRAIAPHHVLGEYRYQHPMFDTGAIAAQRALHTLQGRRRTWFAGSYWGFGFHEDGLQAGLAAAEHLGGVRRPWTVADANGRIYWPTEAEAPLREAAE